MHNKAEYDYSPVSQANDDDEEEEENFWANWKKKRIYGLFGE